MAEHDSFHRVKSFIIVLLLQFAFLRAEDGWKIVEAPNFTINEYINNITFVAEDEWYTGQNASYDGKVIWLNPDPRQAQTRASSNIGKIIYKDPVQFIYPGYGVASFETFFMFRFIMSNPYPKCGSGMAFFIADDYKAPKGSYGRYFGLVSPNATKRSRFFAIEFDTHLTKQFADPSASHIGIDINSLKSLKYVDSKPNSSSPFFPELYLYNNNTLNTWIEHDSPKALIQVWMSSSSSTKPPSPCLSLQYNLSRVFQESMYVGFSATSNASTNGMQGVALSAWNFTLYSPDRQPIIRPNHRKANLRMPLIVAPFGLLLLCGCSVCLRRIPQSIRKKKCKASDQERLLQMRKTSRVFVQNLIHNVSLKEFRFEELLLGCQNFSESNEVGEGTFGIVYKATLGDGKVVAIKRLKAGSRKELEFSTEIGVISNIRHRNLLPLLGWCYDNGEALLIYEYMRRGSLSNYLYGKDRGTLSSKVRLDILAGVAAALEYLHEHLGDCVLHRDVKAGNVLLTEDWRPVLGDFGLARLVRHSEHSVAMTVAGSPGYIAPEVLCSNKFTDKADVYSFGVLLLVVACGRPALVESGSSGSEPSALPIADWIRNLHESSQIMEALDPTMAQGMEEEERRQWMRAVHVGVACIQRCPKLRPTMRQVFQALQGEDFQWMQAPPAGGPGYGDEASSMSVSQPLCPANLPVFFMGVDGKGVASPPCVGLLPSASNALMSATFAQGENCEGR